MRGIAMAGKANARARRLPRAIAAAGLALVTASACSAGTAMVGAHPSAPAVGFGSTASPMQSPAPQTCNTSAASLRPTAQAASGKDVAAIKQRGYLTVGVAADQYLTGYLASDGNEEGFDIDLAHAMANSLFGDSSPAHLHLVAMSTDRRIPDLQNHTVDLVIDTMTINCSRLALVDFSAVYYKAGQRLLVEKTSGYGSLADLAGQKVCAQTGSTSIQLIQSQHPAPIAIEVTDISDCLVLLEENQVSAISTDDTILAGLAKQDPNVEVVGSQLEPEPYGIAMAHGYDDLEEYVNGVLAQYEADGGWTAAYNQWLAGSLQAATAPLAQYSD